MDTGSLHALGLITATGGVAGLDIHKASGIMIGTLARRPDPLVLPINQLYLATDTYQLFQRDRCGEWLLMLSLDYRDLINKPVRLNQVVHEQTHPMLVWTINHNLGYYPHILVLDELGDRIQADESHPSINMVRIKFYSPTIGRAILS